MQEREEQNDTIEITATDGSIVVIRQEVKAEILAAITDWCGSAAGTAAGRRCRHYDAE